VKIKLAYGKTGLDIELSDDLDITIVEPEYLRGCSDPYSELKAALQSPIDLPPLSELVRPTDRVGIIVNDITRPTPNHLIIPAILDQLGHVADQNVVLFNALGTHRPNTETELREMLSDDLVNRFQLIQNDCHDQSTQICFGETSRGHPVWLNKSLIECDVKILTGFIEPHFFAGFSGGGKAVIPGMAGLDTILRNHDAGMIAHPDATWGVTTGNPIWEEVHEIVDKVENTFLVNVALNSDKKITAVFAGDLRNAHAAGCEFVKKNAMVAVAAPFDIVVTTNSGYPLDLNLYQSIKGMSAAAKVVKPGGAIIIASDCWDGIPEHGLYRQLLQQAKDPDDLLRMVSAPGFLKQDQWQAQIQAQIQLKATTYVHSHNLSEQQIDAALLQSCSDIEQTIGQLVLESDSDVRICVLPEGPQTIPYIIET
jgi:nickel-dependent lactate racemase